MTRETFEGLVSDFGDLLWAVGARVAGVGFQLARRAMLDRELSVIALDSSEDGLSRLRQSLAIDALQRVTIVHAPMEDAPVRLGRMCAAGVDVVNASFALPFCTPGRFGALWNWIEQVLRPGGRVHCCVPNMRHIENLEHLVLTGDWRYEEHGVRDRTHLRFFTEKSLRRLFEDAGYRVIEMTGINESWWAPEHRLRRLLFRLFPRFTRDMRFVQILVIGEPC